MSRLRQLIFFWTTKNEVLIRTLLRLLISTSGSDSASNPAALSHSSAESSSAEEDGNPSDNDQRVDVVWAKVARGMRVLASVFNSKLCFTRDIMDDARLLSPAPSQKPGLHQNQCLAPNIS